MMGNTAILWLISALGIALLTTPLLYAAARQARWPAAWRMGSAAMAFGAMLSLGLFLALQTLEQGRIADGFAEDAGTADLVLRSTVSRYLHDVELLGAFFAASSQGVNHAEFQTFTQLHTSSSQSAPGLQALVWAPLVRQDERAAFEAAMRAEGFAGFTIREPLPDGGTAPVGPRATYVVAAYHYPDEPNQPAYGLDLAAEPTRRAAMEQARDSGRAVATPPLPLMSTDQPGFLIIAPVFARGVAVDTVAARRAALAGYVLGAFTDDLASAVAQTPKFQTLQIHLFDMSAGDSLIATYGAPPAVPGRAGGDAPVAPLLAGLHYHQAFAVEGRIWRIVILPTQAYQEQHRTLMPWAVLAIGLAATSGGAYALAQRQARIEAVQHSEQRFRALLEKSANAISLIDAQGKVVYNSPNFYHILGYTPEDRYGADASSLIHPEDLSRLRGVMAEILAVPGANRTFVARMQHEGGSWRWVEVTGTNLLNDPVVGRLVSNMRDITDYKLAEEALRASEARLRTIIQTALDGFWVVDRAQRFIDVNPAYCAMSGYTREEFLTLRVGDIEALERPEETEARIRQIVERGSAVFETRHRRKDGTLFDVEVSVHFVAHDGGQLICFCRDITGRKRREQEIRQLNSDLERRVAERTADLSRLNAELNRALRAKDEFLATMSHELRTPLNSILTFAELLLEQQLGPLNERQGRALEQIDASGHHLLALINEILDLSKIEAGQMVLHLEPHVIHEICELSLRFVRETALKKGLALDFASSDRGTIMEVDAKRLKQMLINLLSNAVKFTPEGGWVRLVVTADDEHEVISFSVEDSGIGIAPEDMGRLFTPFTQLDSGLARQHEGSGLGLALVRRLADLHGGAVTVSSGGPGLGSRFTVTLPLRRSTATAGSPAGPDGALAGLAWGVGAGPRGQSILLAEDNELTIEAVTAYLRGRGYKVTVARNGQEALERAAEAAPDLVLMDIQMPVMDGLEATRRLRATPAGATTPVIALTALTMPGDRERCLAAGASDYVSKPVSLRALGELIANLLGR